MRAHGIDSDGSPYYRVTRHVPIALQLSLRVRRAMFERFLELMAPTAACRVLDLGVTGETSQAEANFFEQWYPYKDRIVCAGIEDASHLERQYPGLTFTRLRAHEPLPFTDGQFDVVFSNAVVEHAGSREQQRYFVGEAVRVARGFFITTPNRWFPIEMHTALPLLHYLPPRVHRRLLSAIGMRYWSSEEHLNLLDAGSLRALFPDDRGVIIAPVRLGAIVSNLIAHSPARASR
jgi:hypothetical protein